MGLGARIGLELNDNDYETGENAKTNGSIFTRPLVH